MCSVDMGHTCCVCVRLGDESTHVVCVVVLGWKHTCSVCGVRIEAHMLCVCSVYSLRVCSSVGWKYTCSV